MKAVKIRVKNFNNPKPEMEYLESLGYKWTATASKPDFAYYLVGEQEGNFLYSPDGRDYDDYKDSHAEVFLEEEFQEIPQPTEDAVNNPKHYTSHPSGIECLDVTRHMSFNLGNATKYIWRCDLKKDAIEDLRKAIFYLNDEINLRLGKKEC